MKETIYTIPLSESLEQDSECPFCYLENKLESEQIDYCLGPAMMEPDHRILSNIKGYCRRHMDQLAGAKRALPFALVLDTRMDEVIQTLEDARGTKKTGKKAGLFAKKEPGASRVAQAAAELTATCLVCERMEHTMSKFFYTFWYLYGKEPDFRKKVLSGKGFCLHHFKEVLNASEKHAGSRREEFLEELTSLELENLKRNKQEVHEFVKQFDYRSDKENWNGPKDAHLICAGKLSKF
jgi:hypothetical protein